jgi:hypothetical protein
MSLYNNSNDPQSYDTSSQQVSTVEVASNPAATAGASLISCRFNSSASRV